MTDILAKAGAVRLVYGDVDDRREPPDREALLEVARRAAALAQALAAVADGYGFVPAEHREALLEEARDVFERTRRVVL